MESTLFANYTHPQRLQPYPSQSRMYSSVLSNNSHITAQPSFVRSSAQLHTSPPQQYYHGSFPQQSSSAEGYQDDSASSSSSNSAVIAHDMNLQEHPQEYSESHYGFAPSSSPQSYHQQVPRSLAWMPEKQQIYNDYASPNFDAQTAAQGRYSDATMYNSGYFDHASKDQSYVPSELTPFYGGQDSGLSQEQALTAYTAQGV